MLQREVLVECGEQDDKLKSFSAMRGLWFCRGMRKEDCGTTVNTISAYTASWVRYVEMWQCLRFEASVLMRTASVE